jgi:hypothetical protein
MSATSGIFNKRNARGEQRFNTARNFIAAKKHKRRKITGADLGSNLQFHFHPAGATSQITGRTNVFAPFEPFRGKCFLVRRRAAFRCRRGKKLLQHLQARRGQLV